MRVWLAPLLVVSSSCTFPDVQFGDAAAPIDSGSDVVIVDDAGDAGDDAPIDPCDLDHDGYKAEGGACGGNDCNDHNAKQHPGADFVTDEPDAAPFGDWNCDGIVEMQYPSTSCGVGTCGTQGFTSNTGCGITNPFVSCNPQALCPANDAGMRTQGCR
jgi:hypothetical protein